jgi:hypothetical protein
MNDGSRCEGLPVVYAEHYKYSETSKAGLSYVKIDEILRSK